MSFVVIKYTFILMPVLFFSLNQRCWAYWQQVTAIIRKNLLQPKLCLSATWWGMGGKPGGLSRWWPAPCGLPSQAIPVMFLATCLSLDWNHASRLLHEIGFCHIVKIQMCSRLHGTSVMWLQMHQWHKCYLRFDHKGSRSRAQHSIFTSLKSFHDLHYLSFSGFVGVEEGYFPDSFFSTLVVVRLK